MPSKTMKPYYDTVILGAGAAGISAARTFMEHGQKNILVVEARDRIGGRTYTHPVYQDLGGAWSHINDPRLQKNGESAHKLDDIERNLISEARKRGFTLSFDAQNSHIYWNGQRVPRETLFEYVERAFCAFDDIVREHGDMPVSQARELMVQRDPFMDWVLRMEFGWGSSGRDIETVSTEASLKHLSCASGVLYKEGLGNVIQDIGQSVLPYTALSTRVAAIRTTDTPLTEIDIVTPEGETRTIRAKHVVSTIPPSVYNHKGDGFAIQHNFPAWKTKAFEALPSGSMNKIVLELPPGFLASRGVDENRHYEVLHNKLGNMFCLACPAGRDVLVAFVGGEQSIALEKQGTQAAVRYAVDFLSTVPELHDIQSHIQSAHFTNWHSDPFSRGAYSTPVIGAANAREKLSAPIDDKIFFAGEACATGGWETHVYGAYETGRQAAESVIAALEHAQDEAPVLNENGEKSWASRSTRTPWVRN